MPRSLPFALHAHEEASDGISTQLSPYVGYKGNARQAMECYREVFGGAREMGTVSDFGAPDSPNADTLGHARLETADGSALMAWDVPAGVPDHPGNNVAVYLGDDDGELRGCFEQLAAGGTVTMPLEQQAWGDDAGALVDRFGIAWMFNITRRQT